MNSPSCEATAATARSASDISSPVNPPVGEPFCRNMVGQTSGTQNPDVEPLKKSFAEVHLATLHETAASRSATLPLARQYQAGMHTQNVTMSSYKKL